MNVIHQVYEIKGVVDSIESSGSSDTKKAVALKNNSDLNNFITDLHPKEKKVAA